MALIDIIITVYNIEDCLDKCLKSVLSQSFCDYEIFLIDDGSTDNSGHICDEYSKLEPKVHVVHKKHGGVSSARNLGIKLSKSQYITFLDGDDCFAQKTLETLYNTAIKYNADIVTGSFDCVDKFGGVIYKIILDNNVLNGENKFLYHYYKNYIHVWGKLFKKKLFKDLKFKEGTNYEDVYIFSEYSNRANKVVCIKDILIYYLSRKGSITHSKYSKTNLQEIDAHLHLLSFYKTKKYYKCIQKESRVLQNIFIVNKNNIKTKKPELNIFIKFYFNKIYKELVLKEKIIFFIKLIKNFFSKH